MKLFITGATGFVGSSVMRRFFNANVEIHALVRRSSDFWRIQDIAEEISIHYGDISSYQSTSDLLHNVKPDVVINCSGLVSGFGINDQDLVIQSNLVNTINLVNASIKADVNTFINTGSSYECGFSSTGISMKRCNNDPIGLYGIAKKAETEYLKMVSKNYSKRYITARLFTPYGFFDKTSRLVPYVISSLLLGKEPIIKNPSAGRDFIFLNDIANVYYILSMASDSLIDFYSLNIGTGNLTRVLEIKSMIYGLLGLAFDHDLQDVEVASNEYLYADKRDIAKMQSLLSIKFTPLKEGLQKTVKWFRENIDNYDNNGMIRRNGGVSKSGF